MGIGAFIKKVRKDNIGVLASIVAWNVLTSIVPIVVGLIAISGFVLKNDPSAQRQVVQHLSLALKGVVTTSDLQSLVNATIKHSGILGVVGFVGVLWGGANVGGAISIVFQAVFEVKGRNFIIEKLIDIVMIFVLAIFMMIIIAATSASTLLDRLVTGFHVPTVATFAIGIAVALLAAFLLFLTIYAVFPNVHPRFKKGNIWPGALLAAILFEILTFIWPIYAHFAHFSKYGAVLAPILLLTAWIYFFAVILLIGAEVVAIRAIRESEARGQSVGPAQEETVPQHSVLRGGNAG